MLNFKDVSVLTKILRTSRAFTDGEARAGDGDLEVEPDRLGSRSRAKQQPPLFSTIQTCPKDRFTLHRQAEDAAKELPRWPPACWYDRRRHRGREPPCSA